MRRSRLNARMLALLNSIEHSIFRFFFAHMPLHARRLKGLFDLLVGATGWSPVVST
jgi:hypothetical protein